METASTVETLERTLEVEEASETLTPLPPDTYVNLAAYAQKLISTASSGGEDLSARLAKKQLWLIAVMTKRLLHVRLAKVSRETGEDGSQPAASGLLPEERYVNDASTRWARREARFVKAVADGQPSFFTLAQRSEIQRMTTVRMAKRVGEVIGADLKRYGPFEVNDVARLPLGNARAMVASAQASFVSGDD